MATPALIEALQQPEAYPHPTGEIRRVETHISWVLLTGDYAYKIKKPVAFDFLDFSTLERRRHFCEEELRLNRRTAPELYLEVLAVTGSAQRPRVGGEGTAIEYAVRMRQFPEDAQLDRRLEQGRLAAAALRDFAARLASFHAQADRSLSDRYGSPERIARAVRENLVETRRVLEAGEPEAFEAVAEWSQRELERRAERLAARATEGMVRECHGDLHLSNLVELDGGIKAFDCIEFDPALRWIDVIDDVAFLLMDLEVRNRSDLGYSFTDAYLGETGDYPAVPLLDLYLVYRSLVRAKIAGLARRAAAEPAKRTAASQRVERHLRVAAGYIAPRCPVMVLMHGLSGSGKSWLAERLVPVLPALRLRSDVERKRLAGLAPAARSGSPVGGGLYEPERSRETYARLARLARLVLEGHRDVIVDAAFLDRNRRSEFLGLAAAAGVRCVILDCRAPQRLLEQRLARRAAKRYEPSEADLAVLAHQLHDRDPLSEAERRHVIAIEHGRPLSPARIAEQIRRHRHSAGSSTNDPGWESGR